MTEPATQKQTPNFSTKAYWDTITAEHMNIARRTFDTQFPAFEKWVSLATDTIKQGNKIIMFGNGGSAADAQHITAEMSVKLRAERAPIAALSLSLDASAITACANDFGFEHIFSRQIQAIGNAGDMAIGLSTSGNSPNVLLALQIARNMKLSTVGLSGETGGKMPALCDVLLHAPSTDPGRIQEMHITLGHMFVGALEKKLGLV